MNKFIQNTKLFFNKKPVRIIVALIVIAGIMTGVAFGIIALLAAVSDPCAKQPGTTWDKDLKVCVKDSCQMDSGEDGIVCKAKGKINKCIAKDYCDYSGPEGQYSYDEETCECKLICNSDEEAFSIKNKSKTTEMNNGTPSNPLQCFKYCDLQKSDGANGSGIYKNYCSSKLYNCGISKNNNRDIIAEGCLDKNSYKLCGDEKYNIYCAGQCLTRSDGTPYCSDDSCTKHYACSLGEDVEKSCGIATATCDPIYDNSRTKNKKLVNWGICSKFKNKIQDQNCGDKDLFGEHPKDKGGGLFNGTNYNIITTNPKGNKGVSLLYPQCKKAGLVDANIPFTNSNLCENGWLVSFSENCKYFGTANPDSVSENELNCCEGQYIKNQNDYTCCATKQPPSNTDKSCFLVTDYPISRSLVKDNASVDEMISCSESLYESDYETFYKNIGLSTSSYQEAKDLKSEYSSGLFCDGTHYKAYCGKEITKNPDGTENQNKFSTYNDPTNKTSGCLMQTKATLETPSNLQTVNIGGASQPEHIQIPLCYMSGDSTKELFWGKLQNDKNVYITDYTRKFSPQYSNVSEEIKYGICKKEAIMSAGVIDVSYSKSNDECNFTEICNSQSYCLPTNGTDDKKKVYWDQLTDSTIYSNVNTDKMFKESKILGELNTTSTCSKYDCISNQNGYNYPLEFLGKKNGPGGGICNGESLCNTQRGCFSTCDIQRIIPKITNLLSPDGKFN